MDEHHHGWHHHPWHEETPEWARHEARRIVEEIEVSTETILAAIAASTDTILAALQPPPPGPPVAATVTFTAS